MGEVQEKKDGKKEEMKTLQNANKVLETGIVALWRPRGKSVWFFTCKNSISFISSLFSFYFQYSGKISLIWHNLTSEGYLLSPKSTVYQV